MVCVVVCVCRKRNSDIFVSEGTTIGTTAATSTKRRKQPFVFYQDYQVCAVISVLWLPLINIYLLMRLQFFNNEKLAEIVNEENRLYDEKQVKLQCYKELKGKESKVRVVYLVLYISCHSTCMHSIVVI